MRKFWAFLMILNFGIFDMVSTYIVYDRLGTFAYETGFLPNLFYSLGGIGAMMVIKLLLTTACAFSLYLIAIKIPQFDRMCTLLCLGASLVGFMAGISNLNGAFTGSTIFVFGIGIDIMAYTIFTIIFLTGLIDVVLAYSKHKVVFPVSTAIDNSPIPDNR